MKVVLFCGGLGTRLREFSETIPKPLVPIGQRPIMWNLMKYYAHYGHKDFILCLGYGGQMIKDYFLNYNDCDSNDFTMSNGGENIQLHGDDIKDWTITFIDTGVHSNIGQRLLKVRHLLKDEDMFLANYSDGLSDFEMDKGIEDLKNSEDAVASFLAVKPSNSLSGVNMDEHGYVEEIEYLSDTMYINGGFMVLKQSIFDYINDGEELVEQPFKRLIGERKLKAHRYDGFWRAMDTFKDKKGFDDLYDRSNRPWEVWNDNGANTIVDRRSK